MGSVLEISYGSERHSTDTSVGYRPTRLSKSSYNTGANKSAGGEGVRGRVGEVVRRRGGEGARWWGNKVARELGGEGVRG